MRSLVARAVALAVGLGIGVGLLALLLRTVSPGRLGQAFAAADYGYVALALIPFVAIVWVKVVRWGLLYGADAPGFSTLFGALNAGYAVNTLTPLRLGELVTAYWVRDHAGIPMARSLSTIALERVSDGMTVLVILIVTAPTVAFPHSLVVPAVTIGLTLSAAIIALGVLSYASATERRWLTGLLDRLEAGRLRVVAGIFRQSLAGLTALRGRSFALFILYTAVIWASNGLLLWLVARAFHLDVPLIAGFLLTGVLYLGMAVPSSPGYIGVFDYLMVLTLGLYGEPHARSVAAAFAAHVINFVPVTLVGLAYLGRHGFVKTMRLAK